MDSAIVRVACALIIVFLVIGAAYFADVVFEPVAFALFFIALVWPLQQALQKRMPRGAALIVTIATTMAIVIKLVSMVAWGGGQIAQWVARNFDRFQSLYLSASKWLEGNDIFAGPIITERFNVAWLFNVFQQVAIRVNSLVGFSLLVFICLGDGASRSRRVRKKFWPPWETRRTARGLRPPPSRSPGKCASTCSCGGRQRRNRPYHLDLRVARRPQARSRLGRHHIRAQLRSLRSNR